MRVEFSSTAEEAAAKGLSAEPMLERAAFSLRIWKKAKTND